MSFYDDASWLLIPSGIEEDIVFAQKPTSGLGDLTFTRASDATYTDSTGVVRRSPYNLVQMSEMFADAYWGKTAGTTITANTTVAPNGTLTADTVAFAASGDSINKIVVLGASIFVGTSWTASIYAKTQTQIISFGGATSGAGTNVYNGAEDVGNGWYRQSITRTWSASGSFNIQIVIATGAASTIQIWGAQLVEGTSALDYFPTTNRQDVPRIDFRNADGTLSSCGRLLLEPQRTNSIRNSSMVGAVAGTPGTAPTNWSLGTAGLTRSIIGTGIESGLPYVDIRFQGVATGISLINYFEDRTSIAASTGQTWSLSTYCKFISNPNPPVSTNLWQVEWTSGGISVVSVNTQTITPSANLERFTYTKTLAGGATTASVQPGIQFALVVGQTYDFTIRIAAPQMELGAYATTWVPTTTAAVTRIADAFTRTNIFTNGLISSAGGTWFVEISDNASVLRDNGAGLFIGDTAFANNGNQIIIRSAAPAAAARFSIIRYISGTATTLHNTTTNKIKVAVKWNGSVMDVFVNGVKVSASNLFTTTTMQNMIAGAGQIFEIDQMLLAATPLSDAECIQLTTL